MPTLIRPTNIRLEVSSRCQLRCPSCPTTAKAIDPVVGSGMLKFTDFKSLVEASPFVKEIEISNYGEVFLNPDLLKILQLAHEKQVGITIMNGANLNNASEEVLEGVVKYGVKAINCSIDGASQETYEQYRVRGNFDRVVGHIRRINHYKELYHSATPSLQWQFIVFGHNEHEIPRAKEMGAELNMTMYFKMTWDSDFSPIRDVEWVKAQTGFKAASREEFAQENHIDYASHICHHLWERPQINWDGKNLGCGRNFWGDFGGNAFKDGLVAAVNHEKIRYARDMLMGLKKPRQDIPCTTCSIYQGMRSRDKWRNPPKNQSSLFFQVRRKLRKWQRRFLGE